MYIFQPLCCPKENLSSWSNFMLATLHSFFALSPHCASLTDKNLQGAASHLKSNILLHLYCHFASSNSQFIRQSAIFQPGSDLRRQVLVQLDSAKGTSATKVRSYRGSGVKELQDYLLLLCVQIQMQLQAQKQIFEMSKAVK